MIRRSFLKSALGFLLAPLAFLRRKPKVEWRKHTAEWENYTNAYIHIDKEELISKMRKAMASHQFIPPIES